MLRLFLCHEPRAKKDVIWIWNYSESASSSDRTCAFFARLRARLQSVIFAASRASLINPLILETRSVCVAFRFFPRADCRLFSAMRRLWFVCCSATADSCDVSCGAIVGASDFSASFPGVTGDGVLPRGRGGPVRTTIRRLGTGGSSNRSSGSGSSDTPSPSRGCGCVTGLTCTAVAQGMFGRFRMLHPLNTPVAQQRSAITERAEQRGETINRTGFSVMFRPRVAVRFGTSCPGRPPK